MTVSGWKVFKFTEPVWTSKSVNRDYHTLAWTRESDWPVAAKQLYLKNFSWYFKNDFQRTPLFPFQLPLVHGHNDHSKWLILHLKTVSLIKVYINAKTDARTSSQCQIFFVQVIEYYLHFEFCIMLIWQNNSKV